MAEMGRQSTRNILRLYGFPETSLDDLPPNEVLVRVRALGEYVASLSKEEREEFEKEIARASPEERKRFIRGTKKQS